MQLTLKVTFIDGAENVVETNLGTIVAWERRFKRKVSRMEADGIGIEDLAFLAYESSRASGIVVPSTLDTYIASLKSLEVIEQLDPKAPKTQ